MATTAVAGTEGGEFVVDAEFVRLSRAPHPDVLDPAAFMLFRGEACETSEPEREVPWWSCRIHGQRVSGYAPRAVFRPKTGEQEARPLRGKNLQEWVSLAWAEKDPKRRDTLLFEGFLAAFRLDAGQCLEGSASHCADAVARRLMLHWTTHVLESPLPPSKPGKALACSAGERLEGCLERTLGPGTLGVGGDLRPGRYAFIYVLPRPPRAVRFVTGEVPSTQGVGRMGSEAYQVEVHADDSREDPLLLEVLHTSGARTVSFGLNEVLEAERYVQNVGGAKTFATNRPLDKGFFALCGKETRKIERPKLVRVAIGLGEFERVLFPEYHYALPCKASFILDESIPGIRTGKRGPGRTCPVRKGGGDEPFTLHQDPVTGDCRAELRGVRESSRIVFSGDLNGDGRPDFILFLVGEMGCGGPRLYLSSPQGWFQAGFSNHYC
jgi:hypothetical protein